MLLEIMTNIVASQDDMDVLTNGGDGMDLAEVAERTKAEVVILARNGDQGRGNEYDELLYDHSRLKVVEITGSGRHGSLYELRPRRLALGEMSPSRLLDVIRSSAQPPHK